MMFSSRSWYFVISFLLVRCRSKSVTLESKDVNNFVQSNCESKGLPASSTKRGDLIGVTQLYRRVQEHPDSKAFAILIGVLVGTLILIGLFLLIYTNLRRRRILDIEKRVVSLDRGTDSPLSPSPSPTKRSSWAVRLQSARRKLWSSIARENKPKAPTYPFHGIEHVAERDHTRASLPFHDIPPLQKPAAAAVLDQSSLRLDIKENVHPVLLPAEGGMLSVSPSDLAAFPDIDAANTRSSRRRVQIPPGSAPHSPDSISIDSTVAQTIIAKANKRKSRHGPPVVGSGESSSRKGSLLSGPPLTVHQQLPTSPTEDDLVDVSAYDSTRRSLDSGEGLR